MRGRALLILISVLAVAVVAPQFAAAKAGGTDRPLQTRGFGTATVDASTVPFQATNEGTAQISHLGRTTYSSDYEIVPGAPGTFSIAGGTTEFVAANGDRLFADFTGSVQVTDPGSTDGTLDFVITGGTGRFEDASGSFTGTVSTVNTSVVGPIVTQDQTTALRGTISY
jgi:hypothetical protein